MPKDCFVIGPIGEFGATRRVNRVRGRYGSMG
jgi:hypothetical protein